MKKHDLLKNEDTVIRVLDVQPDKILIIDCVKKTMPVWVNAVELEPYPECTIGELSSVTGIAMVEVDALDADQKKTMYERYTMIAPILPFVSDDRVRSKVISSTATEHGVSKQTVRNYLCLYLAYMDMTVLAPKKKSDDTELTQDKKNMRWA